MSSKVKSSVGTGGGRTLAPKLRFPEFLGLPVQDLQMVDATTESTERNGTSQATLQIMGVSRVEGIVPMEERIVAADTARYKFVRKDWFAYNPMRLNIGSIARWQGDNDILVSPDYVVFNCKSTGPYRLDPAYLDHFRRSDAWENFVSEKGDGSVRVRIYYKELARLRLALPSFPEQQKIAECLDSTEALIESQRRKVEALKAHKRGLTQQLFPQEGETKPRLRFPEFEGEWGHGELGPKTVKVGSGITPSGGDRNYKSFGRPFVRSQNVGWGELLLDDVAYLDEETHNSFASTEIRLGDVLLNITGASIGRSAVADSRIVGGNVNQHVCIIRVRSAELRSAYLNQYLVSQAGQKQIDSFQAGGNRQGLNFAQIRSFSIPLPPKIDEQQRIADCLTSLDDLVTAEAQKLETFNVHKEGLMQQLFPAVGETDA